MIIFYQLRFLLACLAIATFAIQCKKESKPKKDEGENDARDYRDDDDDDDWRDRDPADYGTTPTPIPGQYSNPGSQFGYGYGDIEIREVSSQYGSGQFGTNDPYTLFVQLNQVYNWRFEARSRSTGQTVPITRIEVFNRPPGMQQTSTNTITFRPTRQEELNGSLRVYTGATNTSTNYGGSYQNGYQDPYQNGYQNNYQNGYQNGYQNNYQNGYQNSYPSTPPYATNTSSSQNTSQTFRWTNGTGTNGTWYSGNSNADFEDILPIYLIQLIPPLINGNFDVNMLVGAFTQAYATTLSMNNPGAYGTNFYLNSSNLYTTNTNNTTRPTTSPRATTPPRATKSPSPSPSPSTSPRPEDD